MPLHIGSVSADVTVLDSELPLSDRQLGRLADAVARVLANRERDACLRRASTEIRRTAQPPDAVRE